MKITKKQLKQIIKEELTAVIQEDEIDEGRFTEDLKWAATEVQRWLGIDPLDWVKASDEKQKELEVHLAARVQRLEDMDRETATRRAERIARSLGRASPTDWEDWQSHRPKPSPEEDEPKKKPEVWKHAQNW